jgi:hypothetical protein
MVTREGSIMEDTVNDSPGGDEQDKIGKRLIHGVYVKKIKTQREREKYFSSILLLVFL